MEMEVKRIEEKAKERRGNKQKSSLRLTTKTPGGVTTASENDDDDLMVGGPVGRPDHRSTRFLPLGIALTCPANFMQG